MLYEITINLHMHTRYSDGSGSHSDIVQAAMHCRHRCRHRHRSQCLGQWTGRLLPNGNSQVLLLVGEEIHDQARQPQKNHLLVFGADKELATQAADPQRLLDSVRQAGGLSFLAHIVDPPSTAMGNKTCPGSIGR